MLTKEEIDNTRNELQENYKRLNEPEDQVLYDLQISSDDLQDVLNMNHPYADDVLKLRDYLDDKMKEKGIPMVPWTLLADDNGNQWFDHSTPWRY